MRKRVCCIALCITCFFLSGCDDREDLKNAKRAVQDHEASLVEEGYNIGYDEGYDYGFSDGHEAAAGEYVSNIENAKFALENAVGVMHSTEQYGGPASFDDVCDDIIDCIYDALAWLEKEP